MIKLYKKLINWRCKFILPSQLENCVLIKKKSTIGEGSEFYKETCPSFCFQALPPVSKHSLPLFRQTFGRNIFQDPGRMTMPWQLPSLQTTMATLALGGRDLKDVYRPFVNIQSTSQQPLNDLLGKSSENDNANGDHGDESNKTGRTHQNSSHNISNDDQIAADADEKYIESSYFRDVPKETPQICPICHKSFERNRNLKQHMRLHQAPGYDCQFCGRSFKWASSYRYHSQNCGQRNETLMMRSLLQQQQVCVADLDDVSKTNSEQNVVDSKEEQATKSTKEDCSNTID